MPLWPNIIESSDEWGAVAMRLFPPKQTNKRPSPVYTAAVEKMPKSPPELSMVASG